MGSNHVFLCNDLCRRLLLNVLFKRFMKSKSLAKNVDEMARSIFKICICGTFIFAEGNF